MEKLKIIVMDEEVENVINKIYDAALKFSGMQARVAVNNIVNSIKQERPDPQSDDFY